MNSTNNKTEKRPNSKTRTLNPSSWSIPSGSAWRLGFYNQLMDVWPSRRRRRRRRRRRSSSSNCEWGWRRMRPQRRRHKVDRSRTYPSSSRLYLDVRRRRHIQHGPSVEEWVGRSCPTPRRPRPIEEDTTNLPRSDGFSRSNRGISLSSAAIAPAGTAERETDHRKGPHTVLCGIVPPGGAGVAGAENTHPVRTGSGSPVCVAAPPDCHARGGGWLPRPPSGPSPPRLVVVWCRRINHHRDDCQRRRCVDPATAGATHASNGNASDHTPVRKSPWTVPV
jgi:hypothetical protein